MARHLRAANYLFLVILQGELAQPSSTSTGEDRLLPLTMRASNTSPPAYRPPAQLSSLRAFRPPLSAYQRGPGRPGSAPASLRSRVRWSDRGCILVGAIDAISVSALFGVPEALGLPGPLAYVRTRHQRRGYLYTRASPPLPKSEGKVGFIGELSARWRGSAHGTCAPTWTLMRACRRIRRKSRIGASLFTTPSAEFPSPGRICQGSQHAKTRCVLPPC